MSPAIANDCVSPLHEPPRTAVLLVNLGTPDAPTTRAVREYLGEFLGDSRVVSIPRLVWWPLLHGVILPLRAPRSARKYAQVWLPQGSPLLVHTRGLAAALQQQLPRLPVEVAMRYGQPSLPSVIEKLRGEGVRKLLVLPLYPQYSTTTTLTVIERVRELAAGFELEFVEDYSTDAHWVEAVAASIRQWRAQRGDGEHLLFSFHGLPQRVADNGDPYPQRVEASIAAITQALGLERGRYSLSFQSRFGKEKWLEPATDAVLEQLAERGIRRVDVVCPGFAVDCLETLEEIAITYAARFKAQGGDLRYIPCLNDSALHAAALATLVQSLN